MTQDNAELAASVVTMREHVAATNEDAVRAEAQVETMRTAKGTALTALREAGLDPDGDLDQQLKAEETAITTEVSSINEAATALKAEAGL